MANTELEELGIDPAEAESRLVEVEREIDFRLENVPDAADETNELYYWASRFFRLMKSWREAYAEAALVQMIQEEGDDNE